MQDQGDVCLDAGRYDPQQDQDAITAGGSQNVSSTAAAGAVDELAGRIAVLLDMHHVMSLATVGPDGPRAVNLFYARHGFTLLWVSDPSSHHSTEIDSDSRVAATIAADFSDFPQVQGLQFSGHAVRITNESQRLSARDHLETRYPFLQAAASASAELRDAYRRAEFYQLMPDRIVLVDNTRGLGFKQTLEFTSDRQFRLLLSS